MKKQILFYIILDVFFVVFLFVYRNLNILFEEQFRRYTDFVYPALLLRSVWLILIGGLFFLLMFVSNRYKFLDQGFMDRLKGIAVDAVLYPIK